MKTTEKHSGKQCKLFTAVSMEQENNGRATCFHGLHCSWFCVKTLGKCNVRALGKTIEKRSGKQAVHWRFRGAGKKSTNIMFSLHSPLITLWENAWKMQRSRARENYRKTFRKTSYTLAFSWSRKTIEKHHVFTAFTVSNSVGKMLGKCSVCALGRTMEKRSGKQALHQRFRGAGK